MSAQLVDIDNRVELMGQGRFVILEQASRHAPMRIQTPVVPEVLGGGAVCLGCSQQAP